MLNSNPSNINPSNNATNTIVQIQPAPNSMILPVQSQTHQQPVRLVPVGQIGQITGYFIYRYILLCCSYF